MSVRTQSSFGSGFFLGAWACEWAAGMGMFAEGWAIYAARAAWKISSDRAESALSRVVFPRPW